MKLKTLGKWLSQLLSCFSLKLPEKTLSYPASTRVINGVALATLLVHKFPKAEIYISDRTGYLLCNLDDIEQFLAQDETNKTPYIPERHDCDDYAYRLMGQFSVPYWSDLAFGLVWSDQHALNCFVDQNEDFWFIEPQTDEILENLKEWMGADLRFIMM